MDNFIENSSIQNEFIEQEKPLKKFLGLKLSTIILQSIITVLIVLLLATSVDTSLEYWELGYAIVFAFVLAFGGIALLIPLILSLVGLIKSIKAYKKGECTLGTLIFFIITMITPIIIYLLSFLIGKEVPLWVA